MLVLPEVSHSGQPYAHVSRLMASVFTTVVLSPLMKASPDMSSLQAASWTDVSSSSIEVPSSPGVRAQQRIRFEHSVSLSALG